MTKKKANVQAILAIGAILILLLGLPWVVSAVDNWAGTQGSAYASFDRLTDAPTNTRIWYTDDIASDSGVYTWRYNDTSQLKTVETVFYANETGVTENTVFFATYDSDTAGGSDDRIYFMMDLNTTDIVEDGIKRMTFTFQTTTDIPNLMINGFHFLGYDAEGTDGDKYSVGSYPKAGTVTVTGMSNDVTWDYDDRPMEIDVEANTPVTYTIDLPTTEVMRMQSDLDGCEEIGVYMYIKTPTAYNLADDVWEFSMDVYTSNVNASSLVQTIWAVIGIALIIMACASTPNWNMIDRGGR